MSAPYRILLAFLTALERLADCALSWLPMYGEAKLALVVYLWHPSTTASQVQKSIFLLHCICSRSSPRGKSETVSARLQGAGRVYGDFLRPFLAAHEADIDRGLLELRARAADATASRLQAAVALARAGLLDAVRRVSSRLQLPAATGSPDGQLLQ